MPSSARLSPWLGELGLLRVDTVVTIVRGETPPQDKVFTLYAIVNQAIG